MDALILELSNIGFTEYEAKAYSMLLQQNLQSASEIYKKTGIPRGRIYDILQQLLQKGFCNIVPGAVNKYTAVDPNIAINNLIEQQRKETKLREQKMVQTANILHERFASREDTSSPLDYIHVLTSKPSMVKKYYELNDSANEIVRTFNKGPYLVVLDPASVMKESELREENLKKGKIGKSLYEIDKENTDQFIKHIQYFISPREEIRLCDHLPMKMLISDNNAVMVSLRHNGNPKTKLTAMIVEHSDLTNALIELFDIYWEKAIPLDEFIKKNKINC